MSAHSLWGLVAAVFPNQMGIIFLPPIKKGHIVKAAVGVRLQEELVEIHLDDLEDRNININTPLSPAGWMVLHAVENMLLTISGSTVISQEQLVPAGYFWSGQLGVLSSPWDLVIFPPQN